MVAEFVRMLPIMRRDPAFGQFSVHRDPADSDRVMIYETWGSREQLDRLIATAEVQAHFARVSILLRAEPESSSWTLLEASSSGPQRALP